MLPNLIFYRGVRSASAAARQRRLLHAAVRQHLHQRARSPGVNDGAGTLTAVLVGTDSTTRPKHLVPVGGIKRFLPK
jgi:hypothetical protein